MSMCDGPTCTLSPSGLHEFDRGRAAKCIHCGCSSNDTYCRASKMCPMGGVHTVTGDKFGKCAKCGCIFAGGGYKFRRTKRTKRTKSNKKRKTKRKKSNKKRKTKRKI